jgi:integrase
MCTYLTKRGSTYYYRRVIPTELRAAFGGKSEFTTSLRSKDREDAKRKLPHETLRVERLLEQARVQLGLNSPSAPSPAPLTWPFRESDIEQAEAVARMDAEQDNRREARRSRRDEWEFLGGSTAEMLPDRAALHDRLREAAEDRQIEEERKLARRARRPGPGEDSPASAVAPQGAKGGGGAAVPLLDIFDAYAAAQRIKPGTAREWRSRIGDLIGFLGHDDAARLTEDDVQRWRDHLLSEPVRGGKTRDPRTVRSTYITALRATLAWAKEERKLPSNVAASIVVRVPRKAKLRERDFTADEAKRILQASLKTDDSLSPERAFARRWIPWLCAYTGARVNEFSQLRREDVKQIDGTWVVTITPEAGTVKANAARTIPLHAHLIDQGFVAAVQARQEGPLFYDPSKRRVESDGSRYFKKVGERLADWVRNVVGVSDPNIMPNHAWRHTFKTLALTSNMPERIADYIQGHAPKTVGRTYGSVPLIVLRDAIEAMPRFNLD